MRNMGREIDQMSTSERSDWEFDAVDFDQSSDVGIEYYLLSKQAIADENKRLAGFHPTGLAELRESDPESYRLVMYGWA